MANKTHEGKQNVESSSFDADWEKGQAHFADNKKDRAEHLAAAAAAQKDVVQAKAEYVDSKKAMDAIPGMLTDVAKESDGDLDKRIAQEEAKRK